MTLEEEFGAIDIYLFDQLLRGRITARDRVLDAGCGFGRNLVYLMRLGCDVHAADADADAIAAVRSMAATLAPQLGRFAELVLQQSPLVVVQLAKQIANQQIAHRFQSKEEARVERASWKSISCCILKFVGRCSRPA